MPPTESIRAMAKYKRNKNLKKNLAVHPFVVIGITAALAMVVLVAIAWRFWAK